MRHNLGESTGSAIENKVKSGANESSRSSSSSSSTTTTTTTSPTESNPDSDSSVQAHAGSGSDDESEDSSVERRVSFARLFAKGKALKVKEARTGASPSLSARELAQSVPGRDDDDEGAGETPASQTRSESDRSISISSPPNTVPDSGNSVQAQAGSDSDDESEGSSLEGRASSARLLSKANAGRHKQACHVLRPTLSRREVMHSTPGRYDGEEDPGETDCDSAEADSDSEVDSDGISPDPRNTVHVYDSESRVQNHSVDCDPTGGSPLIEFSPPTSPAANHSHQRGWQREPSATASPSPLIEFSPPHQPSIRLARARTQSSHLPETNEQGTEDNDKNKPRPKNNIETQKKIDDPFLGPPKQGWTWYMTEYSLAPPPPFPDSYRHTQGRERSRSPSPTPGPRGRDGRRHRQLPPPGLKFPRGRFQQACTLEARGWRAPQVWDRYGEEYVERSEPRWDGPTTPSTRDEEHASYHRKPASMLHTPRW
ncbi:hypothetical protein B0A55_05756 [Friedmanniomyces simplex]|uniref:Uncharacterized protein n=1 Tax=Friedmanniomyces simplex TaxID=329884 RepID=A0A4V5NIW0_9PEZI|nr:hypothetical protein B0A55_05756 [Friedmanniomyces simplex]